MSKTAQLVLKILTSGDIHSGESIGKTLGISRMAISKAIKVLNQEGLKISSRPGRGYQLASPVQLLDKQVICSSLNQISMLNCEIEVLQQVDSTSDYLLDQSAKRDIHRLVCLTENQRSGRGRRQRVWHASPYRNIVLSIGWRFDDGMSALSGLGIAAGITIARTLHEAGFSRELGLKWPNDIVCLDSKLGGLLIDVRGEHNGPCLAVLGLGLNIVLTDEEKKTIDQPCTSLEQISRDAIDRNSLVVEIVHALTELFENYTSLGFESFHPDWSKYDRLYKREVKVIRGKDMFSGIAIGIDESGALLLDEGNGALSRFLSGDVSLRLVQ